MLTHVAEIARPGTFAGGAALRAGRPVKIDTAANALHPDMPKYIPAGNNDVDVFVLFPQNSNLTAPYPAGQLTPDLAGGYQLVDARNVGSPVWTENMYRANPQSIEAFDVPSGMKIVAVRGGPVTLPSGVFTHSATLYGGGSPLIKVDSNGKYAVTSTNAEAIGRVIAILSVDNSIVVDFFGSPNF